MTGEPMSGDDGGGLNVLRVWLIGGADGEMHNFLEARMRFL